MKIVVSSIVVLYVGASVAQAVSVTPTKSAGDFIAGSGIPSDNFTSGSGSGVSVYLKARGRDSGQALAQFGTTYQLAQGAAVSNPGASWWSFDFQFSPKATDTVAGTNYVLTLDFDTDPTAATSFTTVSAVIFDADTSPFNSWDDTDGFFVNPKDSSWSENTTDYVFSQSWRPDFSFLAGGILGPGLYALRFTASDLVGNTLATTSITAQVIPLPSAAGLGLVGLAFGFAGFRRRVV